MAKIKKQMKGGSKVAAAGGKGGKRGPETDQVRARRAPQLLPCVNAVAWY